MFSANSLQNTHRHTVYRQVKHDLTRSAARLGGRGGGGERGGREGERGHERGLLPSRALQSGAAVTESNKTRRTKADMEKAPRPRQTLALVSHKPGCSCAPQGQARQVRLHFLKSFEWEDKGTEQNSSGSCAVSRTSRRGDAQSFLQITWSRSYLHISKVKQSKVFLGLFDLVVFSTFPLFT